jgi:hypothetical protein
MTILKRIVGAKDAKFFYSLKESASVDYLLIERSVSFIKQRSLCYHKEVFMQIKTARLISTGISWIFAALSFLLFMFCISIIREGW